MMNKEKELKDNESHPNTTTDQSSMPEDQSGDNGSPSDRKDEDQSLSSEESLSPNHTDNPPVEPDHQESTESENDIVQNSNSGQEHKTETPETTSTPEPISEDEEKSESVEKIENNSASIHSEIKPDKVQDKSYEEPSNVQDENDSSTMEQETELVPNDWIPSESKEEILESISSDRPTDQKEPESPTDQKEPESATDQKEPGSPTDQKEPGSPTDQKEPESPTVQKEPESPTDQREPESKDEISKENSTDPEVEKEQEKEDNEELTSEHDLKEKGDDHEDDDEHEELDYSSMNKSELVNVVKALAKEDNVIKAEKQAREVKVAFDEIKEQERSAALKRFLADGGETGDFAWRPDEFILRFDANYQLIRDKRNSYVKTKENQKEQNLQKKQQLLESLREFVDSEETNISFDRFKALQEEWKKVGPLPGSYARTLWANYNALVDRFYDNRSIYFELKELDRRKNLESKLELCRKAEALIQKENINEAIKDLNELHHDFKHIGPVPKEDQEELWQQFKGASDAVYDRRKKFVERLKSDLDENLKIKLELAEQVHEFSTFDSDRIKAWNEKTKDLLQIQKKWENTGGLPRARAKDVNRTFWSAFKAFFSNKNHFFKRLDAEREVNLEKKKNMVEKAKALKESDDWQETANALKDLQQEWKDTGPVPGKYRESIYREFKSACDTFFERKRSQRDESSREYVDNYNRKIEIIEEIRSLAAADKNNLETFKDLQEEYGETGFVPKNKISEIRKAYTGVVNKFVNALDGISREEKQQIKIENQVSDILHGPNADQKLYRKEQTLRKQISTIENDIALWKNNLEFFADSKKADKLKDEFHTKIKSASDELKELKQQLRIIRTA